MLVSFNLFLLETKTDRCDTFQRQFTNVVLVGNVICWHAVGSFACRKEISSLQTRTGALHK